jgi:hypothetical protein
LLARGINDDLVHLLNLFVYMAIMIPSVVYEHGSHDGKNITRILVVYGNACVILERLTYRTLENIDIELREE